MSNKAKFNFKGFIKGGQIAKQENERQRALKRYKSLYYGLTSILYPIWEEAWKEMPGNTFKQERFYLCPGKREADGSYTFPEVDWDAYNEFRSQCWQEFLEHDLGIMKPLEVMPMRDIKSSRENLIAFCRENGQELGFPEGETSVMPDEAQVIEHLIQVNTENLRSRGQYTTQQLPEEVAF